MNSLERIYSQIEESLKKASLQADQWFKNVNQQLRNMGIDLTSVAMALGYPFLPAVAFGVGISEGLKLLPVPPPPTPPYAVPPSPPVAFR